MTHRIHLGLSACVILVYAAACGDGALVAIGGEDKPEYKGEGYKLEIVSPQPLALDTLAVGTLTVKLTKQDAPVPGEDVTFTVVGDAKGSRLSALRARTGESGEATVEVIAGGQPVAFEIEIETKYTTPLTAEVVVSGQAVEPATLEVAVAWPDQAQNPIVAAYVDVRDDGTSCADALTWPAAGNADATITDLSQKAVFENRRGGSTVTVIVSGYSSVTRIAEGCVDGVMLTGGQTTTVTVTLSPRPRDLTGAYDYEVSFDMSGAVPGTVGDVINVLAQMFDDPDDPARYLVDQVESLLGTTIPTFIKNTAIRMVDDLIRNIVPPEFLQWAQYVGDAARVVTTPTFAGTLTIGEAMDGSLSAVERWTEVVFTWRGKCDPAANPGCDERRIALRNTMVGEVSATYGVTENGDLLEAAEHTRQIQYARFFHVFILNVVYPEIVPGATSSADMLHAFINCTNFADTLDESDGTVDGIFDIGVTFTNQEIEQYCGDALNLVGGLVDDQLDRLASGVESTVTLTGIAEIVDADKDLVVEKLDNGQWQGTIQVDGTDELVTGTWSATRR
ncbi:MAG: hypothetical protein D6729_12055 [Deltaproteobacteria bacterium]|nr:MAG: hypothetical protein D6729_12055 [Deltaproteobacteria bacterium]